MKQVGKRLAALVLCICMLVGMPLSVSVSAEEPFAVSHIVEMPDWMAVQGAVVGGTVDTNAKGRTLLVYFNSDPTSAPPSNWRYFISTHRNGGLGLDTFVWAKYNDSYVFPNNNPIAITMMTQEEANNSGYTNPAGRGYDGTLQEYFAAQATGNYVRTLHLTIADNAATPANWDGYLVGNFTNANGMTLKSNRLNPDGTPMRQNGNTYLTPAIEEALTLDEALIVNDSTLKVKFSQEIDLSKLNTADGFTMKLAITNPNNDYIGPEWNSTAVSAMGNGWYKVSFAAGDVRAAQAELAEIHTSRTDRKLVFYLDDKKEVTNFLIESVVSTESGMSLIASPKNKQWTDTNFPSGLRNDVAVCELTEAPTTVTVTLQSAYQLDNSTVLAQFSEPINVSGLGSTFKTFLRITNNNGDVLASGTSAELDGHWGSPVSNVSKYYSKTATKIELIDTDSNWYRIIFEDGAVDEVLGWGKKIDAVQPREYKIQLTFEETGAKTRGEDNNGMLECIGALSGSGVLEATKMAENDSAQVVMSPAESLVGAQLLEDDTVEMTFSAAIDLSDLTAQVVLHGASDDTVWSVGSITAKADDANTLVGKVIPGIGGVSAYDALYNMGTDESMEVRIYSVNEEETGDDDAWVKEGLVASAPSDTARDAATASLVQSFSITHVEIMSDALIDAMGGAEGDKGRTLLVYFNSNPASAPPDNFRFFIRTSTDGGLTANKGEWYAKYNADYGFTGWNPIAITLMTKEEAQAARDVSEYPQQWGAADSIDNTLTLADCNGSEANSMYVLFSDGAGGKNSQTDLTLENWTNTSGVGMKVTKKLDGSYMRNCGYVTCTPAVVEPLVISEANLYDDNQIRIAFTHDVYLNEDMPLMQVVAKAADGAITELGTIDNSTLAYYGRGSKILSAKVDPFTGTSPISSRVPDGAQLGILIHSDIVDDNGSVDEIHNDTRKLQATEFTSKGDTTGDKAFGVVNAVAGTMPIPKDIEIRDTAEFLSQSQMLVTLSEAVDFTTTKANILLVDSSNQVKLDENGKPYAWAGVLSYHGEVKSRLVFTFGGTKGNPYGNANHPYDGLDELLNSGLDGNGYKFILCLSDSAQKADGVIGTITAESANTLPAHGYLAEYGDAVYLTMNKEEVPQGELKLEKIEIIDDMRAVATFSAPVEVVATPFIAIRLFNQAEGLIYVDKDGKFTRSSKDPDTQEANTAMQWGMKWEYANAEQTQIYLYPNANVLGKSGFSDIMFHNWKETILANCTSDITDVLLQIGIEELDTKTFTVLRSNKRVDNIRMKGNEGVALTALKIGGYDGIFVEPSVLYTPRTIAITSAKMINELQIRVTFSSPINITGDVFTCLRYVYEDNSLVKYGEAPNITWATWVGTWKWENESHTSIIWTMNGYNTFGVNNISDIVNLRKAMSVLPDGGIYRFAIEEMNVTDVITYTPRNGVLDNVSDGDGKNHLRANRSSNPDGYYVDVNLAPLKGTNGVDLISAKAVDDQTIELTFSEGVLIADDETAPTLEIRYRSVSGVTEALANGKYAIFKGTWSYKDENKNVIVWKLNSKNAKNLTEIFNFEGHLRWNNTAEIVFAIENGEGIAVSRAERLFGITSLDGYRLLNTDFSTTPSLMLKVEIAYDKPEPEVESDGEQEMEIEYVTNYLPFIVGGGVAVVVAATVMIVLISKKKEEK